MLPILKCLPKRESKDLSSFLVAISGSGAPAAGVLRLLHPLLPKHGSPPLQAVPWAQGSSVAEDVSGRRDRGAASGCHPQKSKETS